MNKLSQRLFPLILLLFFIVMPVSGQTSSQEQIQNFQSDIQIRTDGSIEVKETIVYDFGPEERRGIFRNIPLVTENKEGKKYQMEFEVISVTDEQGESYEYKETIEDAVLAVRVGNPNKYLRGIHTYVINYTVKGALTYFSDHDELYWDSTGGDWGVPIKVVSVTIHVPESTPTEQIKGICYTGNDYSIENDCTVNPVDKSVKFSTNNELAAGEELTVAVSFPKNIVAVLEPKEVVPFSETWQGKLVMLGIFGLALFWYILYPIWLPIKWYLYGRDPSSTVGEVKAWFDPPKTKSGRPLNPAEVGTLIDERAQDRDISAMIVSLAQRGFLTIVEKNKNEFHLKKNIDHKIDSLLPYERDFMSSLFSSKDELNLKTAKISKAVEEVKKALYADLVTEGFFPHNPHSSRTFYEVISGLALFTLNIPLVISTLIFGQNMPVKTLFGVDAAKIGQSLKNFLSSQERQLEFQARNQMMFEKLLPFAVAFGVERIWAERFKDIALKQPEWYQGPHTGNFNSVYFTNSLHSSFNQVSHASTPTTSSTGHSSGFSGGSAGGGGGGGGGGSW